MALTGRDAKEYDQRREETLKKLAASGKSAGQLGLASRQMVFGTPRVGYFTEENMTTVLKAQCKRLAGQSHVIGNTVFAFDKNGICRIAHQANAIYDFEELLKLNGVVRLNADETVAPSDHVSAAAAAEVAAPAVSEEIALEMTIDDVQQAVAAEEPKTAADVDQGVIIPDAPVEDVKEAVKAEDDRKKSRRNPK